jgi:hypothetical protein
VKFLIFAFDLPAPDHIRGCVGGAASWGFFRPSVSPHGGPRSPLPAHRVKIFVSSNI